MSEDQVDSATGIEKGKCLHLFARIDVLNVVCVAHGRAVVAILDQERTESQVLASDCILQVPCKLYPFSQQQKIRPYLVDLRKQEVGQERTEDAQGTGHEKLILASTNLVGSILLHDGKDVGANESANLANCRSIRVILTTDGGCAGLGRTQTDIVAWAEFTEGKENIAPVK